ANGKIASGLSCCHTCDVRRCVNPEHLFLGTTADNHHDAMRKGRNAKGEKQGLSKLTKRNVETIRSLRGKVTQVELAKRYGVHWHTIARAQSGETWKYTPHD